MSNVWSTILRVVNKRKKKRREIEKLKNEWQNFVPDIVIDNNHIDNKRREHLRTESKEQFYIFHMKSNNYMVNVLYQ